MDLEPRGRLPHSSTRGNVGTFGPQWLCSAGPRWTSGPLGHHCGGAAWPLPSSSLSLGTGSAPFSEQEEEAPPRPPLPELYSPEDPPPAVPPLPREATVIRHTSVRGLKRQSDERKRDREQGQCVNGDSRVSRTLGMPAVEGNGMTLGRYDSLLLCPQVELRSYVSEPELTTFSGDMAQPSLGLVGPESRYQTLPSRGKATLSTEGSGNPQHCQPLLATLTRRLAPFCLQLRAVGSSCHRALGFREAGPSFLWPIPWFSLFITSICSGKW